MKHASIALGGAPAARPRPVAAAPKPYRFPRFEIVTLDNGLRVIVAPVRTLPVVTALLLVDAGASTEPAGRDGVANLTARGLLEGTLQRDGNALTEQFERLGASVFSGADWDTANAGVTVLREHVEPAIALLGELALAPSFPERDIARLRAERLADLLQMRTEPRGLADEMFARFVYDPFSRYARPEEGGSDTVATLTRDDVRRFYTERYRPRGSTFVLVGDVSVDEGVSIATRTFGGWDGVVSPTAPPADAPARRTRAAHLVRKADAPQSELRVGHIGLPRRHPDYFRVMVMNAVLGGLFSSRINLNLREAHAYTYGAFSGFAWRRGAGPFVVSTAVENDVTADAAREILLEIDRIRAAPISADELSLATSYLGGVFPIKYETTDAIALALAALAAYELPIDYFDTYRDAVRAVSTADVLDAAQRYLHPDALQVVVVGDASQIRAPLAAMALGPMLEYGADGVEISGD
ncbi:MAG TPA: pitrilysin family protein [Gemmatimonadaceae bacterium]|nr:pitrilysin family protein [Gemmatimonadaceae bacterium]